MKPALFLDRDGVINEEVNYLWRTADCRLVDGIIPLLLTAHQVGFFTVVVTNQAGIGRGLYTEDDFHHLMNYIQGELRTHGAALDAIYFSPFHPEHGVGDYRRESDCRKPGPGMMQRAAAEHKLDLGRSVLVGDRCTDIAAGAAAGVPNLFLFGTTESTPCDVSTSYTTVNKLNLVEEALLQLAGPGLPDTSPPDRPASEIR